MRLQMLGPKGAPLGAPLKPHPLVGWVLLAHGETMGHGASRHQRLALWDAFFDTPSRGAPRQQTPHLGN